MTYQSMAKVPKIFYGVEFKPGEIHDVPGYINDLRFIVATEQSAPNKTAQNKPAKAKPAESTALSTADKPSESSK